MARYAACLCIVFSFLLVGPAPRAYAQGDALGAYNMVTRPEDRTAGIKKLEQQVGKKPSSKVLWGTDNSIRNEYKKKLNAYKTPCNQLTRPAFAGKNSHSESCRYND